MKVQWKPSKDCPPKHPIAPKGISIVFCPGITGEALKWKVISCPPITSPSAGIPLTVKSPGWTLFGITGALRKMTKSVGWVNTMLSQAGWDPTTKQGGSLGVGVTLVVDVAVAVAVALAVEVAVAVAVGVGVNGGPQG